MLLFPTEVETVMIAAVTIHLRIPAVCTENRAWVYPDVHQMPAVIVPLPSGS